MSLQSITGSVLNDMPIKNLKHVADLVYFDGPLLSHFQCERGLDYIYSWCDCDDQVNRWLFFQADSRILRLVTEQVLPMIDLFASGIVNDWIYVVDISGNHKNLKIERVLRTRLRYIPKEYLPDSKVLLEADAE